MDRRAFFKLAATAVAATCLTTVSPEVLAASRKPARRRRAPAVSLEHIDVLRGDDGNPFAAIAPCVKVLRTVYDRAQAGAKLSLKFHLKYKSRGKTAVKNAFVAMTAMRIAPGHPTDDPTFVFLDTRIDVRNRPVDGGAGVTGTVQLKKRGRV